MPKNKKNKNNIEDKKEKGSNLLTMLIVFLIVIIWIVIFILFVKLDIGRFGSSVLYPLISDIPVINRILPEGASAGLNDKDGQQEENPYRSMEEALKKITELERQIEELESRPTESNNEELQKEINRLKIFEENQLKFEELKLKFDKNVVFAENAPSIDQYKEYYEQINPANAEVIYRQVIEQLQFSQAIKEKADIYRKMTPKAAADIMETMTADIEFVAKILLNMKPKESAAILEQMDSVAASKVTKKMIDIDDERLSQSN